MSAAPPGNEPRASSETCELWRDRHDSPVQSREYRATALLRSGPRIGGRRPRERAELNEGGVGQITGENDGRGRKTEFGRSGPGQPAVECRHANEETARNDGLPLHDGE